MLYLEFLIKVDKVPTMLVGPLPGERGWESWGLSLGKAFPPEVGVGKKM